MSASPLATAAETVLGEPVASMRSLHGGSLSEVVLLVCESGRRAVAKTGPLVAREARMLTAIRTARAPAPAVLGVADGVLLLEALDEAPPGRAGWRNLGGALRGLHDTAGPHYGWDEDYAFGKVPIPNAPLDDWPTFWAERRLLPALPMLPPDIGRRVTRLAGRVADLLPARPRAALLHGDLWAGNALFGPNGTAHLIDPACYFGHGEVDLAMMDLFGNPPADFAGAYGPLEPGAAERRAIYQLWPALVHLMLFGGGYRSTVTARLDALGA